MGFESWCEAQGVDAKSAQAAAQIMRMSPQDLANFAKSRGEKWGDELTELARERRGKLDEFIESRARKIGPRSFAELSTERIRGLANQRLVALEGSADGTRGALMLGPTGSGKSIVAALVARKRMLSEARRSYDTVESEMAKRAEWHTGKRIYTFGVEWRSASQLSRIRRSHPLGKGEAPEIERAFEARLLVIDDLGWEPAQDPVCADVLSERYDRGLPTIVTSGMTESELTGRYGAALVRRITETAGKDGLMVDLFSENETAER